MNEKIPLNPLIRKASEPDFPQILNNEKLCYPVPWSEALLKQSLTAGKGFYVMQVDHELVGHMVFQTVLDELHLHNICITPKWQQQGLAKEWLCFLMNFGKQNHCKCILLEVRSSNQVAKQFYLNSGFGKIGYRKNYYSTFDDEQEDALVMKLTF